MLLIVHISQRPYSINDPPTAKLGEGAERGRKTEEEVDLAAMACVGSYPFLFPNLPTSFFSLAFSQIAGAGLRRHIAHQKAFGGEKGI